MQLLRQEVINELGLTWRKPFPNQKKQNYIFHELSSLVTFKELKNCCQEGEGSASRSKQKEGQREKITRFCSIICEFSIFLCCLL